MKKSKRKSIRLQEYDYSQEGMYFVTICTHKKQCYFGEIVNESMCLNFIGKKVEENWKKIPEHYSNIELNEFVIMPNHMHGLISIIDRSAKQHILGLVIGSFKSSVTKWVRENSKINVLWQRNYYEHVVRNEHDYQRIGEYIIANPILWEQDSLHPKNDLHNPLLIENP